MRNSRTFRLSTEGAAGYQPRLKQTDDGRDALQRDPGSHVQ
jgi:hypothetical protein